MRVRRVPLLQRMSSPSTGDGEGRTDDDLGDCGGEGECWVDDAASGLILDGSFPRVGRGGGGDGGACAQRDIGSDDDDCGAGIGGTAAPGGAAAVASSVSPRRRRRRRRRGGALRSLKEGYDRRMAADPSFRDKSILEITLAVLTQCAAEYGTRGWGGMASEFDFVFAGVLTAVCGE